MFSGIIEGLGTIRSITPTSGGALFVFATPVGFLSATHIGDSIAVNGTCLTVIQKENENFSADLSHETLSLTVFAEAQVGDVVNIEHTLTLQKGIDGHLVSGHIDGLGVVASIIERGDNKQINIKVPKELDKYIVKKGSVAVNGVSLTVNAIEDDVFSLNIIPHTLIATNLGKLHTGDKVNVEVDLIARHLEKLINNK